MQIGSRVVLPLLLLALLGGLTLTAGAPSQPVPPASKPATRLAARPPKPAYAEVGVERLARNPAAFRGRTFVLRGVVSAVAPQRQMFTVIDQKEYDSCRELGCSAYQIPITFTGALPETARSVLITGRLEQPQPGRYLMRASQVALAPR